jgi:hypothetical protein
MISDAENNEVPVSAIMEQYAEDAICTPMIRIGRYLLHVGDAKLLVEELQQCIKNCNAMGKALKKAGL